MKIDYKINELLLLQTAFIVEFEKIAFRFLSFEGDQREVPFNVHSF